MKQVVLFILLSIMAYAASAQKYSFTLKGDIINVKGGKVCLYSPVDSVRALLTTEMKDGLFTLAGELDEPGLYTLDVAGARFAIVLDGREMMLYGDYLEPDSKLLKGSDAVKTRLALDQLHYESFDMVVNEGLGKYYEMIENEQIEEAEGFIGQVIRDASANWGTHLLEFVKTHPDDLYVPVRLMEEVKKASEWGKKAYEALTPKIQASQPGRLLKEMLK